MNRFLSGGPKFSGLARARSLDGHIAAAADARRFAEAA